MENSDEDSSCVYLEFTEKLTPSIFANKMFLRIANLETSSPLVQINDLLFKGTYDEAVGTNLFFEEIEDPPLKANIFEDNPPIRLKSTISQSKIIKLRQVKLPRQAPSDKQCKESIVLNLNQDYHTVLEKLEQGLLNVDDLAHKEHEQSLEDDFADMNFDSSEEILLEPEKEIDSILEGSDNTTPTAILEAKYEKLKRLARRPVKRMKSLELIEECEPQFRESYEYHNLEKHICQSSDAFRSVSYPIIEKSFIGGVDIDRCILQGLLPMNIGFNHMLTKEEQRKIFTIDNFENLSLPARYLVLKECVSQIEELIENTPSEELKEIDENGKNIADIREIFRRLVRALECAIAQGGENEDLSVNVRTDLSGKSDEEYVKYRYNPTSDVLSEIEIFNLDDWIDKEEEVINEEEKSEEERRDFEESDDSVGEESS